MSLWALFLCLHRIVYFLCCVAFQFALLPFIYFCFFSRALEALPSKSLLHSCCEAFTCFLQVLLCFQVLHTHTELMAWEFLLLVAAFASVHVCSIFSSVCSCTCLWSTLVQVQVSLIQTCDILLICSLSSADSFISSLWNIAGLLCLLFLYCKTMISPGQKAASRVKVYSYISF